MLSLSGPQLTGGLEGVEGPNSIGGKNWRKHVVDLILTSAAAKGFKILLNS